MTIETKVKPGDYVWYMGDNKCQEGEVDMVTITMENNPYFVLQTEINISIKNVNHKLFKPSEIFLSKKELIDAL